MPVVDYDNASHAVLPTHQSIGSRSFNAQQASLDVDLQSQRPIFRALNVGASFFDTLGAAGGLDGQGNTLLRLAQPLANTWVRNVSNTLEEKVLAHFQLVMKQNTMTVASTPIFNRPPPLAQLFLIHAALEQSLSRQLRTDREATEVAFVSAQIMQVVATELRDQVLGMSGLVQSAQDSLAQGQGAISQLSIGENATAQQLTALSTHLAVLDTHLNQVLTNATAVLAVPVQTAEQLSVPSAQLRQSINGVASQLSRRVSALANSELISVMVLSPLAAMNTTTLQTLNQQFVEQISALQTVRASSTATQRDIQAAVQQVQLTYQARLAAMEPIEGTVRSTMQSATIIVNGVSTDDPDIGEILMGAGKLAIAAYAFLGPSAFLAGIGGTGAALGFMAEGLGGVFSGLSRRSRDNGARAIINVILPVLNQISQQVENLHTYVELRANHTDGLIISLGDRVDNLGSQLENVGVVLRVDISELRQQISQQYGQIINNFLRVSDDLAGIRRLVETVADNSNAILDMLDAIARQVHGDSDSYNRIETQTINIYDAQTYNPSRPLDSLTTYQQFVSLIAIGTQGATAPAVHGDTLGPPNLPTIARIALNNTLDNVNSLLTFAGSQGGEVTSRSLPLNLSVPYDMPYSPTLGSRVVNPVIWAKVVDATIKFISNVPELELGANHRHLIQDMTAYGEQFLQTVLGLKTSPQPVLSLLAGYASTFSQFIVQLQGIVLDTLNANDADIARDMQAFQARILQPASAELDNNINTSLRALEPILSAIRDQFFDCNFVDYRLPLGRHSCSLIELFSSYPFGYSSIMVFEQVQMQNRRLPYSNRPVESCYSPAAWRLINRSFSQLLHYDDNCQHPVNREFVTFVVSFFREYLSNFSIFRAKVQTALLSPIDFLNTSVPYNFSALYLPWQSLSHNSMNASLFSVLAQLSLVIDQLSVCRSEQFDYACRWPRQSCSGSFWPNDYCYQHSGYRLTSRANGGYLEIDWDCPSYFVQDNSLFNAYLGDQDRSIVSDVNFINPNGRMWCRTWGESFQAAPFQRIFPNFSNAFLQSRNNLNHEVRNINAYSVSYTQYIQDISDAASAIANKLLLKNQLNHPNVSSPVVELLNIASWMLHNATQAQRNAVHVEILAQLSADNPLKQIMNQLLQYKRAIELLLQLAYGSEFSADIALQQMLSQLWSGDDIEAAIRGYNASNANSSIFVRLYRDVLNEPVRANGTVADLPWATLAQYLRARARSARVLQNQSALSPDYQFVVERLQLLYFIRDVLLPQGISPLALTADVIARAFQGRGVSAIGSANEILLALERQGLDIDRTDSAGNSAFMLLAQACNQTALMQLLNRTGVNVNRVNDQAQSALNLALSCPHRTTREAMLAFLLSRGVGACLATDTLESTLLSAGLPMRLLTNISCLTFTSTTVTRTSTSWTVTSTTPTSTTSVTITRTTPTQTSTTITHTETSSTPTSTTSTMSQTSMTSSSITTLTVTQTTPTATSTTPTETTTTLTLTSSTGTSSTLTATSTTPTETTTTFTLTSSTGTSSTLTATSTTPTETSTTFTLTDVTDASDALASTTTETHVSSDQFAPPADPDSIGSNAQDQAAQQNNQPLTETSVSVIAVSTALVLIAGMVIAYLRSLHQSNSRSSRISPVINGANPYFNGAFERTAPVQDEGPAFDVVTNRPDQLLSEDLPSDVLNPPAQLQIGRGVGYRVGVAETMAVAVSLVMANVAEAAEPSPIPDTNSFIPPEPEPTVRTDDGLKTLYRQNLAPHAHIAEYLKITHQVNDTLADTLMQPFNDFTGNIMLLQVFAHVMKEFFFREESGEYSQPILVEKSSEHIKRINKLEQAIGHNQSVLERFKAKYPEHDFSWAEFCLGEYKDTLSVLSEGDQIDLQVLNDLRADMKQFKLDMKSDVEMLKQGEYLFVAEEQSRMGRLYESIDPQLLGQTDKSVLSSIAANDTSHLQSVGMFGCRAVGNQSVNMSLTNSPAVSC